MTGRIARLAVAAALLAASAPARADEVSMGNGVKMTGVVDRDTDGETILRVSSDGFIAIDTATVSVHYASKAENARISAGWKADEDRQVREAADDKKFADEQRSKGLIEYEGEWLTPTQFDRRFALDRYQSGADRPRAAYSYSYSYNYVYSRTYSSYSYAYPHVIHLYHGGSLSPSSVRHYVSPAPSAGGSYRPYGFAGVSRGTPSLYDHEAGMGAGSHYGW